MEEESCLKGPENSFNKIIEKIPNLKKEMPKKVQKAYRTPNKLEQKLKFPCHIIKKILKIKSKERILKVEYKWKRPSNR